MSDSIVLQNKIISKLAGGDIDFPRFYDTIHPVETAEEEPEEIMSRFNKLRRKK